MTRRGRMERATPEQVIAIRKEYAAGRRGPLLRLDLVKKFDTDFKTVRAALDGSLNTKLARAIRKEHEAALARVVTYASLGRKYGLYTLTIAHIVRRATWGWVEEDK